MKLLLLSNSTNVGEDYLAWPRKQIADFLKDKSVKRCLFIPYAGVTVSWDDYTLKVSGVFQQLGYLIESIHNFQDPCQAVSNAECIIIGGGNTFRLVEQLRRYNLVEVIRQKVLGGTPYIGWSAGSNVACPTMKTTNDMPVVEPGSFVTLNLLPFQINPHYLDANPVGHAGETREQRILEFLELNHNIRVVGMREASGLLHENSTLHLVGKRPMRIFQFGQEPFEVIPGDDLSFLMKAI
jgi:dipeptidase E